MGIASSLQQNTHSLLSRFIPRKYRMPMEAKENPMWAGQILYSDSPQPISMSKDFKTFVRDGYKEVDTLYKCIRYITQNGAAIRPVLYTDDTMQEKIKKHPLLTLLNKPNNEQSGVAYREAVIGFKLIAGDSFQYSLRPNGRSVPPMELWPLRPDWVQILVKRHKGITGYKYEWFNDPILPENIGHTKYWNPDDDDRPGRGMSPIEVAALTAQMLRDGKRWNLSRLQNDARPPGAWTTPSIMDPNSLRELEKALNKKFSGKNNAGRIPVLHSGLKWESMGLSPAEMDYLDMIKYSGGSVANIFNIPPQLIGDTSSTTYDNMEQAKMASYTEAIFPELDDLYAEWNVWLLPMYPDLAGTYLYYDKESVEVIQKMIQDQKSAKADRSTKMWLSGLIMHNEAREMADMPPHPQGNVFRIGKDLVDADHIKDYAIGAPKPAPALPSPQEQPPVDEQQENDDTPPDDRDDDATDNASAKLNRLIIRAKKENEEQAGVMVAFFLSEEAANGLALPDGESPEQMHITLAYLGKEADLDIDLDELKDLLSDFAASVLPLEGATSGIGRFSPSDSSDGLSPIYASVNIPGIQKLHLSLVERLEEEGIELKNSYEYSPHITLMYIDDEEETPISSVPAVDLRFDQLWLAYGNERFAFPMDTAVKARKCKPRNAYQLWMEEMTA